MSKASKEGARRQERGEATRRRLLEAAIDVFGDQGPEAATRTLANRAGVNLAAIPYHFGSKQGLYLAAAEHIASEIGTRIGPALDQARQAIDQPEGRGLDKGAASALLTGVLEAFARMMVDPVSAGFARFIIREQMEPTAAFERLHAGFIGRTFNTLAKLIAVIRDGDPEDPAIRLLAPRLIGQVMVLRAARATVLRELRWDDIGDEEFEMIRNAIRENVETLERGAKSAGDGA
ncbi:MAG: CerR family C-terminal domain-containing protein [Alphaproteobacteria bacterium]